MYFTLNITREAGLKMSHFVFNFDFCSELSLDECRHNYIDKIEEEEKITEGRH